MTKAARRTLTLLLIALALALPTVPLTLAPSPIAADPDPVELAGMRTASSKTYDMGNGELKTVIVLGRLHYQDGYGNWQEVNNRIVDGQMLGDAYNFRILQDTFDSGQIAEWSMDGEYVRFQPMPLGWINDLNMIQQISTPQAVSGLVANTASGLMKEGDDYRWGSITWDDPYGSNTSFEWRTLPGTLRKILTLSSAPLAPAQHIIDGGGAALRLSFIFAPSSGADIYVDGQIWDKRTKTSTFEAIEFRRAGEQLWEFAPAYYWDSMGERVGAETILRKSGSNLLVDVLVPHSWLTGAAYPVHVDPTATIYADKDTHLREDYPTDNADGLGYVEVACSNSNAVRRAILEFDLPDLTGCTLTSATLSLRIDTTTAAGRTYWACKLTRTDWVESQATWNVYKTGSSWTSAGGDYVTTSPNKASATVPGSGTMTWAVLDIVDDACNSTNIAEFLVRDGTEVANFKNTRFHDRDYVFQSFRPRLSVTYTVPPPSVTTGACSHEQADSVQGNAEVTDTGTGNITERGFCYMEGVAGTPTVADDTKSESGSWGTGTYNLTIDGLTPGTSYRVRAYAYNEYNELGYGATVQTATLEAPTVDTHAATSVGETQATLQGEITDIGGSSPTVRGFDWGTTTGSYSASWNETGTFGTGTFPHGVTGLTRGTVYYYRAFAINAQGTGYGDEESFIMLPAVPTGFNATATGGTTITLNWTVGAGANSTYIRGKEGSYPTDRADGYLVYSGTGNTTDDTGLVPGPTYYYKAWSYASGGGLEAYSSTYDEDYATPVSSLVLWFQLNDLVSGDTLVDRTGGNDGTVDWGENPAGVTVAIDSMVSTTQPEQDTSVEEPYRDVVPDVEISDWYQEPAVATTLATHPLRPLVTLMSDSTTATEQQAWRLLGLAIVLLCTVAAAALVRGHLLIACLICAGAIGVMVQQTIFPGWALVFVIPAIVAGIIAERTPSVG